ncbi:hypothetical protein [Pseudomonas sp. QTF5]|nr:hypothetical protein [Pseudomonas sp. QTF5]
MGLFDYKNAGSEAGKALYSDAIALTLYAYNVCVKAACTRGSGASRD